MGLLAETRVVMMKDLHVDEVKGECELTSGDVPEESRSLEKML